MSMWLYQLSQDVWPVSEFRCDIWESARTYWDSRTTVPHGAMPERGDIIVFFYAQTNCDEPGIYGWGIVDRRNQEEVYFTPTTPTNQLKVDPWWDEEAEKLTDEIRPMPRATMFRIDDPKLIDRMKRGIRKWLSN